MLLGKPDIVMREVDPPEDHCCDSGHPPIETYRRGGPDSPAEPVKYFQVSTKDAGVIGIFCEPCLVVANHMKRLKRKQAESLGGKNGRADPIQPEVE